MDSTRFRPEETIVGNPEFVEAAHSIAFVTYLSEEGF
jgi:hypothetical protein